LWGKPSQGKAKKVDRKKYSIQTYKRHHILETSHPSPLSAHNGFMDSNHFVQCNEILVRLGKDPIDWTLA
jgi:uracil-DNA glycosylase